MVRLQARGAESRIAVIGALLDEPSQTEDELISATKLSKSTVRNTLQLLLQCDLATSKRRVRHDGKRGPGPIEYWLTERGDPASLEQRLVDRAAKLREGAAPEVHHVAGKTVTVRAEGPGLFVIVKAGTNDAVLTKDGRMLRVEERALPQVLEQYQRVLRGTELETMRLDDYFRRFYPELEGKGRDGAGAKARARDLVL